MALSNKIPYPPRAAFSASEAGSSELQLTQEGQVMYVIRKIVSGGKEYMYFTRPDGGLDLKEVTTGEYVPPTGQFKYHHGLLFPSKGHVYPEALAAVNVIKKFLITAMLVLSQKELVFSYLGFVILPWRWKKRIIGAALIRFGQLSGPIVHAHFLKEEFAMRPALAIKQFVDAIVREFAPTNKYAGSVGETIAAIFEYDNAYTERLQDIMSECDEDALAKNPYNELERLLDIFVAREQGAKLKLHLGKTLLLLRVLLWMPRIRTIFRRAVLSTNFEDLKMTEADRYHALFTYGYNFMGRTFEDRQAELSRLHNGVIPQGIEVVGTRD